MITFKCNSCGVTLRVSNDKAGRKGKCPNCAGPIAVPLQRASQEAEPAPSGSFPDVMGAIDRGLLAEAVERDMKAAPKGERICGACHTPVPSGARGCPACGALFGGTDAPGAVLRGDRYCPSCNGPLPVNARICVKCGIRVRSGRPVITARGVDEDMLQIRAEKVIRPLSWLLPFGIYPVYSEARGKARPYTTWAIATATVLISIWFWMYDWSGSPKMRSMKNLMLWTGSAEPDPQRIVEFYRFTSYGDPDAFLAKRKQLEGRVPYHELDKAAYDALSPEQQCFGQYRFTQLITHAFLHGGLLHLAGNLLFLLIFGSRVNAVLGNLGTLVLYPALGIVAGLVHMWSAASGQPTPMLGASGAIMGMAGVYLVLFPMHKVHMVAWWRWGLLAAFRLSRKFFAMSGFVVVLFYIAFDIMYTVLGVKTTTAHWAHMGGFIAGIAAAVVLLCSRVVYSGSDVLSLVLGKYAWGFIGSPSDHQGRTPGLLRFWDRKPPGTPGAG